MMITFESNGSTLMTYCAGSVADLRQLQSHIETLPPSDRTYLAVFMIEKGLMRMPWFAQLLVRTVRFCKGHEGAALFHITFLSRNGQLDKFYKDVFNHMFNGKDLYEPQKSAGGFCQDEIDQIVKFMEGLKRA
jgi:hypothetical protein